MDKAEIRRQTLTRLDGALKLVRPYEARGIAPERVMEEPDRLKDRRGIFRQPMEPGNTGQAG